MLRKISSCLAMAIVSIFLASCTSAGTNNATVSTGPTTVMATEKDDNTTVALNKGDILKVELAGNPTTGYQWQQIGANTAVLLQLGEPEFTPDSSAAGSPGKVDIRFEAIGSGQMQLQLNYGRSFEPQAPVDKTFRINVSVK